MGPHYVIAVVDCCLAERHQNASKTEWLRPLGPIGMPPPVLPRPTSTPFPTPAPRPIPTPLTPGAIDIVTGLDPLGDNLDQVYT